jgi:triosephosphate isomerase (TIM)
MRTPFVGGNWKMNTSRASATALAAAVGDAVARERLDSRCEVAVFPPFVYLEAVGNVLIDRGGWVKLGAQDMSPEPDGAFTGEISAHMLKDLGVSVVLTGHSERRHVIGETDEFINRKTRAALDAGLHVIFCIGEKLDERERGETDKVNLRQTRAGLAGVKPEQMARLTIAYEPVWAIGTGKTATPADAQNAHRVIRACVGDLFGPAIAVDVRIQYGGSVKGSNAGELFGQPDIDGGLIGGASLKADEFLSIVKAAAASHAG